MIGGPYYCRESSGFGTNLQLYSLRVAWRLLNELKSRQEHLQESRIRERCVVIMDLLGLSLSQLLGQNTPSNSKMVPSPTKMLDNLLINTNMDLNKKQNLKNQFEKFVEFYDACRHFGISKHENIDRLTLNITDDFCELAIEIWDFVCVHSDSDSHASHPVDFNSVREILDDDEEDNINE